MPELPEVETVLQGIRPHVENQVIRKVIVRFQQLRWTIPSEITKLLQNQKIQSISRRAKYLLFQTKIGVLIIHLGMSGRLRVLNQEIPAKKHDHVDFIFSHKKILRFTDPRRFGAVLWTSDIATHPLINQLGPEPLSDNFTANYLYAQTRSRKTSIKNFLMNSHCVAGIGNIYAVEILFVAGIHPQLSVSQLNLKQCQILVKSVQTVLRSAIQQGGTTLKDFSNADGNPGFFKLALQVYGRANLPCYICKGRLSAYRSGQRSTVYCPQCQK